MKKTRIVFLTLMLLTLIIVLIFLLFSLSQITGETIRNYYSYTKAVCNGTNYCEDYEIICKDDGVLSINPTGAVVQFPKDWKDPRDEEMIEKIC